MLTTQTSFSLSAVLLLTGVALPRAAYSPSHYSARLSGAAAITLSGSAEFGRPPSSDGGPPFVITLGAHGEEGAVVFTSWDGRQPGPGTYSISAEPSSDGIQALVVTGTPEHPAGVFRARRGTLTITASDRRRLSGRFEMDAEGYLASQPEQEDRALVVEGAFDAIASVTGGVGP